MAAAVVLLPIQFERNEDVRLLNRIRKWMDERCRQDANYVRGDPVQHNFSTDERWISAEPAPPEAVAEDHHRRCPGPIVVGGEVTAEARRNAQDFQKAGRYPRADEALG